MPKINFFTEDTQFVLPNKKVLREWVEAIVRMEGSMIQELNFIFCSDNYLLSINQEFLQHDFYTDIITFDNSDKEGLLASDVFISIDRVKENASSLNISWEDELYRVMIHGVLHLLNYNDKTEDQKIQMRQKEDACISLLKK